MFTDVPNAAMTSDEKPHILHIDISRWRFFVFALIVNGAFTAFVLTSILGDGRVSAITWVPLLIFHIAFVPIFSALMVVFASYMFRFEIKDGVLCREFVLHEQRKSLDDVKSVLDLFVVITAHVSFFERGFMLPGRMLLNAENKAKLSEYAKHHLNETHPLFSFWVNTSGVVNKPLAR